MTRVIIADDHQLFREGLTVLLNKNEHIDVVAEAESGESLIEILSHTPCDIVLIDITMGELNGLEVIKQIHKKYPETGFIVLTMHNEGQFVIKAIRNGADGFLLKNADEKEVIDAIFKVRQGQKYFAEDVSRLMIQNMTMEGDIKQLSEREKEVLIMVAEGKTTKEIANELIVSTRTVETHRANMMRKLDVQNTAELIKKATKIGIL